MSSDNRTRKTAKDGKSSTNKMTRDRTDDDQQGAEDATEKAEGALTKAAEEIADIVSGHRSDSKSRSRS